MAQDLSKPKVAVTRRSFLSLASVAAAQGALAQTAASAEADAAAKEPDADELVYRETTHISTYYQRNRF